MIIFSINHSDCKTLSVVSCILLRLLSCFVRSIIQNSWNSSIEVFLLLTTHHVFNYAFTPKALVRWQWQTPAVAKCQSQFEVERRSTLCKWAASHLKQQPIVQWEKLKEPKWTHLQRSLKVPPLCPPSASACSRQHDASNQSIHRCSWRTIRVHYCILTRNTNNRVAVFGKITGHRSVVCLHPCLSLHVIFKCVQTHMHVVMCALTICCGCEEIQS